MKKMSRYLAAAVVLSIAGIANAQQSKDAFVQNREEKKEAKKEYKNHEISKQQYKEEKKAANDKLRATGEKPTAQTNIEFPGSSPYTTTGR